MKRRFLVGGPRVLGQSGLVRVGRPRKCRSQPRVRPTAAARLGAAAGAPGASMGRSRTRVTLAASRRFGLGARQLEAGRGLRLVGTASASGLPAPQPASGTMGLGSGWGQCHRRSGGPPCRWRMLGAAARRVAEDGHLGSRGAGWPCNSTSTPAGGLCHHRHLEYCRGLRARLRVEVGLLRRVSNETAFRGFSRPGALRRPQGQLESGGLLCIERAMNLRSPALQGALQKGRPSSESPRDSGV